jgi:hypothetical protein
MNDNTTNQGTSDDVQGFGRPGGSGVELPSLIGIPPSGVVTAAVPQLPVPGGATADSQVIPLGRKHGATAGV